MSKYAEIKDKYPQDRGGYDENAKVVIEEYQQTETYDPEGTVADANAKTVVRDRWDKIADLA